MRHQGAAGPGATVDISELLRGGADPTVPGRLRTLHRSAGPDTVFVFRNRDAAGWPRDLLDAVLEGAGLGASSDIGRPAPRGFAIRERVWTLPDSVGAGMRLLVVGLNPSPMAADLGVGFARPGNRFWPAALEANLVGIDRDPEAALADHGVGMTDLVKRTTRQASQLSRTEYAHGLQRLTAMVEWLRPGVVCVVGLSGWRSAVDRAAVAGPQETSLGTRPVYLMPNPSGLNAHVTVSGLAEHFRDALAAVPSD